MANVQQLNGTAAPTDATQYYQAGDIVINNAPVSTGFVQQWRCVASGYPGTWQAEQVGATVSLTTTATTGTLTSGYKLHLLNAASGPTLSLPLATNHPVDFEVVIKNIANNSATLAPVAANGYVDAAAITLAQFAVVRMISNGGTNWYKSA